MLFICYRCKQELPLQLCQRWPKEKICRPCNAQRIEEWRQRNPDRIWAVRDPEGWKQYQQEYHKRRFAEDPEYRERRKAHIKAYCQERRANDPEFLHRQKVAVRMNNARRKYKQDALAQVFREEIKAFYLACPEGYQVDHVHPRVIKKDGVHIASGLHVPWNLQYLTAEENNRKQNSFDEAA